MLPKAPSSLKRSLNFLNMLPKAPSSLNKSFIFFIRLANAPSLENILLSPFINPLTAFTKPLKKSAHCFAALYTDAAATPAAI